MLSCITRRTTDGNASCAICRADFDSEIDVKPERGDGAVWRGDFDWDKPNWVNPMIAGSTGESRIERAMH